MRWRAEAGLVSQVAWRSMEEKQQLRRPILAIRIPSGVILHSLTIDSFNGRQHTDWSGYRSAETQEDSAMSR